ncbi:23 kDa unknown protein [Oyster mushroom spherical virus]|uniref:23 kDa unknown protein n=1 Tax=Oyster mushroom spherical virus TaxID=218667 RepID=UPI0000005CD0|nr:23 kDa unknown protein [Oyster mushroom spherical virus]AAO26223.1 23 kDa unknown protein [Oyster mushroom spherical virus]
MFSFPPGPCLFSNALSAFPSAHLPEPLSLRPLATSIPLRFLPSKPCAPSFPGCRLCPSHLTATLLCHHLIWKSSLAQRTRVLSISPAAFAPMEPLNLPICTKPLSAPELRRYSVVLSAQVLQSALHPRRLWLPSYGHPKCPPSLRDLCLMASSPASISAGMVLMDALSTSTSRARSCSKDLDTASYEHVHLPPNAILLQLLTNVFPFLSF